MKKIISITICLLSAVFVFSQGFDFGTDFDFPMPGPSGNPVIDKGRAKADDAQDKMRGLIPMRFYNALDRKPIEGASVVIPIAGTFKTNAEGKIAFPKIADGNYTLVFSKEGFITTDIDFRVALGNIIMSNWYSISPGIEGKDYRIILEWADKPADLDLHFEKTGGYHISFFNMHNAEDGNALLDRDDTSGYGPETITINKLDMNANYICWVHDYTNSNRSNSDQMAKEGAVIRVYSQNRLLNSFRIPANGVGTKWTVFRIEKGKLIPVNTVTAR
jgi:uncharacterized protein YfaP (DUF2135 family)